MNDKIVEFQELGAEHLFAFVDVADAIGVEKFAEVFKQENLKGIVDASQDKGNTKETTKAAEKAEALKKDSGIAVAMKLLAVFIKGLHSAKEPIYAFFASCTNLTIDEIKNMGLVPFTRMIKEFFAKEELHDFFVEVSELFSTAQ